MPNTRLGFVLRDRLPPSLHLESCGYPSPDGKGVKPGVEGSPVAAVAPTASDDGIFAFGFALDAQVQDAQVQDAQAREAPATTTTTIATSLFGTSTCCSLQRAWQHYSNDFNSTTIDLTEAVSAQLPQRPLRALASFDYMAGDTAPEADNGDVPALQTDSSGSDRAKQKRLCGRAWRIRRR